MNTPICDFVRRYADSEPARLHMPGHKGMGQTERLDITEIPGADVLYHPTGIILQSERNAARLFGSRRTVYSTEGSSLCIRAMVYLAVQHALLGGKKPRIAAGRNAHKTFLTAAALLDVPVDWLYPEEGGTLLSCEITPRRLETYLSSGEAPTAVYITSPDYLGNMADIRGLSRVCRAHGCLLLVDNAHGAYLGFLPEPVHPMALGADVCCDSAHKTLPVLTGGAYLHISRHAPEALDAAADWAMALFASTSPSYLILQSLDAANVRLDGQWRQALAEAVPVWAALKENIAALGFPLTGQEPLKLTVMPKPFGYTGEQLSALLEKQGFFCEFADPDYLVLMLPVEFPQALPERLLAAFAAIEPRSGIPTLPPAPGRAQAVLSPHEALLRPAQVTGIHEALGKIIADPSVSCPPAIPIVCCGERIDAPAVAAMEYYGIPRVAVLRDEPERSGMQAAAVPTVFLHGLGQSAESWKPVTELLGSAVNPICPSLFSMLPGQTLSYANLYRAVSGLCDAQAGKINLCGLSIGAVLALQYAAEHPEKVGRLVLIAGQYRSPKALLALQNLLFRLMPEKNFAQLGIAKRDFMTFMKSMRSMDLSACLSSLRTPTLLLCGAQDRANRNASLAMAERIAGSTLRFIAPSGHEVNRDNPEALAEALSTVL